MVPEEKVGAIMIQAGKNRVKIEDTGEVRIKSVSIERGGSHK